MAKIADLTEAQRKSLQDFDMLLRATIIQLHKSVRLARAASQQYNATILPIVSVLDGTEDLPTQSGLAGIAPLAKGDPGFLMSYLNALTTFYDASLGDATHMNLYVKAAGSINLIGE